MDRRKFRAAVPVLVGALLGAVGCRQDMHDQPKYKPFRASAFFADGRGSRPLVDGTVARGHLNEDTLFYTGKVGNDFAAEVPFAVTADVVRRGQQRFDVFCSPCHDRTGAGGGMIVQRGYRHPPSFHTDRLRQQRVGYFVDVMTNGFGTMPNYAQQVPPADRWAIAAYIRALQLSQHASVTDVPEAERPQLDAPVRPAAAAPASGHHE